MFIPVSSTHRFSASSMKSVAEAQNQEGQKPLMPAFPHGDTDKHYRSIWAPCAETKSQCTAEKLLSSFKRILPVSQFTLYNTTLQGGSVCSLDCSSGNCCCSWSWISRILASEVYPPEPLVYFLVMEREDYGIALPQMSHCTRRSLMCTFSMLFPAQNASQSQLPNPGVPG